MPINLIIRNPLDRDAREFIQRAGVTDAAGRAQLNQFVRGVKQLGLWESMVCWPLRSTQNAATGTTAFSLGGLGTFNGTLIGGPTWGTAGVTFDGTDDRISTALSINATQGLLSTFVVFRRTLQGNEVRSLIGHRASVITGVRLLFENQVWLYSDYTGGLGAAFTNIAGVSNNVWASAAFSLNKSAFTGTLWQNSTSASLASTASIATGSGVIGIGTQSSTHPTELWRGDIAFAVVFDGTSLNSSQHANLLALYKQTLGTGLGLP